MGSEEAESMLIKVFKKSSGARVLPSVATLSDTNSLIQERKALFKLDKGAYAVELEFAGDVYDHNGDEEPCIYFDLTIAINAISSLSQKLNCD